MNNSSARVLVTLLLFLITSVLTISAIAQVGTNNLFCPHVPYPEGMLNLQISPSTSGLPVPDFSAGMIGTLESINYKVTGGIDWLYMSGSTSSVAILAPTNELGSQLISWWSLANNRSTKIQVTNASDNTGPHISDGSLSVHIEIFNDECLETLDFCDTLTAFDTHVYDLSDLETNTGNDITASNLDNKEGYIVVTAVNNCLNPIVEAAIDHNFLSGNIYISDPLGYTYGTNMYARQAICIAPGCTGILTGLEGSSFDQVLPSQTYGLFKNQSSYAGSDVVVINLHDDYGPPYRPVAASSLYSVDIVDMDENLISCGNATACFMRLGINSMLPARQDLLPPPTPEP